LFSTSDRLDVKGLALFCIYHDSFLHQLLVDDISLILLNGSWLLLLNLLIDLDDISVLIIIDYKSGLGTLFLFLFFWLFASLQETIQIGFVNLDLADYFLCHLVCGSLELIER
jgi:hypothetical protein